MRNKKTLFFTKRQLPNARVGIFTGISLLLIAGSMLPSWQKNVIATAASCNTISECQEQIDHNNSAVASLQTAASDYQTAINQLSAQIASIEKQIAISQTRLTQLQSEITIAQQQLDHQKEVLSDLIKSMYVNGQMSTVEMLATSKDLSTFVDAETYRTAVQGKIQSTLTQITDLQNQLKVQQGQVNQQLAIQQAKQGQIAAAEAKQQSLLSYNQSQQATYNAQTAQSQQQLQELIAAQLAANNSASGGYYFLRFPGKILRDPINGSYPYANAGFGMSTAPGCVDNDGPDQWGYCTRQCVSYAAWAVAYSGRQAPIDYGNANDWVPAARNAGIPIYTSNPQPGDVAIDVEGQWGHAMYVEKVSGNQIYVSQYNQQLTGHFSTQWRTWE